MAIFWIMTIILHLTLAMITNRLHIHTIVKTSAASSKRYLYLRLQPYKAIYSVLESWWIHAASSFYLQLQHRNQIKQLNPSNIQPTGFLKKHLLKHISVDWYTLWGCHGCWFCTSWKLKKQIRIKHLFHLVSLTCPSLLYFGKFFNEWYPLTDTSSDKLMHRLSHRHANKSSSLSSGLPDISNEIGEVN